jgi:hypothetical protein
VDAEAFFNARRVAPVTLAAIQDDLDLVVRREGSGEMREEVRLISRDQDDPLGLAARCFRN